MQRLYDFWNNFNEGPAAKIRNSFETTWRQALPAKKSSAIFFFFIVLSAAAFLTVRFFNHSEIIENLTRETELDAIPFQSHHHKIPKTPRKIVEFPLNCTLPVNQTTLTCPTNYPTTFEPEKDEGDNLSSCPDYFKWIHNDLEPWKVTGITLDILKSGQPKADFRLIILNGKAYLETYRRSFQSRDIFTVWGILQLLRKYPGKIPDLDLMFNCGDMPMVYAKDYKGPNVTAPPVFHYCNDGGSMDVVFPDWSFWGWPEINIKAWEPLSTELIEGNNKMKWLEREPHAYWRGNPDVAWTRQDLLKCNVSAKQDWGARLYRHDWLKEIQAGFKQSNLASQCIHRYKIYIQGRAWSVSEKYILACNSLTLLVSTEYYDFYSRNLMPMEHYWPINTNDKCKSIKFAVDWGENHKKKAQLLAKAGSEYILDDMKMDYVYDYMFHLLNEYAKLLKFKPTVPPGATELCSETMACGRSGREKDFMIDSMVKAPSRTKPCTVSAPYHRKDIESIQKRKQNVIKKVQKWEKKYWDRQKKSKH